MYVYSYVHVCILDSCLAAAVLVLCPRPPQRILIFGMGGGMFPAFVQHQVGVLRYVLVCCSVLQTVRRSGLWYLINFFVICT